MLEAKSYENFIEITRIFKKAVKKAQDIHRKKGIPNVYLKNGKIVWELSNGEYVTENPFKNEELRQNLKRED